MKRIQLPRRSPNLNAFAERFVGSIKHGCLGQMIFFSKSSLKSAGVQGESQWWLSLEDGQAYINEFQRLIDEEHGQGSWSGTRLIRFLRAYTGKHVESFGEEISESGHDINYNAKVSFLGDSKYVVGTREGKLLLFQ